MTSIEIKNSAAILKTLGNAYRLQIVTLLLNGEKNVSELNQSVRVSQPALSQHLNKLKRANILGCRREQRKIFYYLREPKILRIIGVCREIAEDMVEEKRKRA